MADGFCHAKVVKHLVPDYIKISSLCSANNKTHSPNLDSLSSGTQALLSVSFRFLFKSHPRHSDLIHHPGAFNFQRVSRPCKKIEDLLVLLDDESRYSRAKSMRNLAAFLGRTSQTLSNSKKFGNLLLMTQSFPYARWQHNRVFPKIYPVIECFRLQP